MEKISEHITYTEATQSQTATEKGILNTPSAVELQKMKEVAEACFEPARKWWGKPLIINSFFRCAELNKAVGGAPTSQHKNGEAIDLSTGSREGNKKLIEWMKANLKYDQLINEYPNEKGEPKWIHVSFRKGNNRNQFLTVK